MPRKSLEHFNCSWAQTAEAIGDKWSLMILRCAFFGASSFSEFLDELEISKNVLTLRLDHLVSHDILIRQPSRPGGTRFIYKLTKKGRALFPAIVALGQWADHWIFEETGAPVVLIDRNSKEPIQDVKVLDSEGRPLKLGEVTFVAGPGADSSTQRIVDWNRA